MLSYVTYLPLVGHLDSGVVTFKKGPVGLEYCSTWHIATNDYRYVYSWSLLFTLGLMWFDCSCFCLDFEGGSRTVFLFDSNV